MDTNINAVINAAIRAEHPEQPQSEPERKPVRLIDANSIKYTTRTIEHSQGGAPPVTFAYKEDIDKLPTVELVGRCKDCRYKDYAEVNKEGFLICSALNMEITDFDYCSYFERKKGE